MKSNREASPATPAAPPSVPGEADIEALRKEVLSQVSCFPNHPEYSLSDPAFVDGIIKDTLQHKNALGAVPDLRSERRKIVYDAVANYNSALLKPEGKALLEKQIQERFANPTVIEKDGAVTVNMGLIPGPVTWSTRTGLFLGSSEHYDRFEWRAAEAAAQFKAALARYPKAKSVRLVVDMSSGSGIVRWQYIYDSAADIIAVIAPDLKEGGAYLTSKLGRDFDAIAQGKRSLQTKELTLDKTYRPPA